MSGATAEHIVLRAVQLIEDAQSALDGDRDLQPEPALQVLQQGSAFVHQLASAPDLEMHEVLERGVAKMLAEVLLGDPEAQHFVLRKVDPVFRFEIDRGVLPEIDELQRRADAVGVPQVLRGVFPEQGQKKPADRIGGAAAVVEHLGEIGITEFDDVLAERVQQVVDQLLRESVLAAGIFGYSNPRTLDYAKNLGTAFQLTNIIRDVGEDSRKNRIYLPMDELKKFDVPANDILQAKDSDNFRKLMAFQVARANEYYRKAFDALPPEDRKTQRAGLIMAAIYRATLAEVERDGFKVLTQRTSLTPLRKLWLAWKTWVGA